MGPRYWKQNPTHFKGTVGAVCRVFFSAHLFYLHSITVDFVGQWKKGFCLLKPRHRLPQGMHCFLNQFAERIAEFYLRTFDI